MARKDKAKVPGATIGTPPAPKGPAKITGIPPAPSAPLKPPAPVIPRSAAKIEPPPIPKLQPGMDEPKQRKYFAGTVDKSPFQNITLGGFCFPLFTNELTPNDEGSGMVHNKRKGVVLDLYDYEVERIKEAAKRKVVRWNINKTRAFMVSVDSRYKKSSYDESVLNYVYLVALDSMKDPQWRETCPAPLSGKI